MTSRKGWSALSPGYRARLQRKGITESAYNRGASIKAARGHSKTPEHGMREALRKPRKYKEYIERNPQAEAIELNSVRDRAYANMRNRLGDYHSWNGRNVTANVYGGVRGPQHRSESDQVTVEGMSYDEADWTARADTEAIRSRASDQNHTNPWWYH